MPNFLDNCKSLINKSIKFYEAEANQYRGKIFDKIHKEMCEYIFSRLFNCFDNQLKLLALKTSKEFSYNIKKLVKKGQVNDKFDIKSQKIYEESIGLF